MDNFYLLPERAFRSLGGRLVTLEGGGKKQKAPDYKGAAEQQAQSSKEVTNIQNWANRPEMSTPWGKMEWGTSAVTDPATGQPVTKWTGNLSLSPQEQASLDSQQAVQTGRSQAAETLLGQATGAFKTPADWSKLPGLQTLGSTGYDPTKARDRAESALFQRQMGMIEPGLTQSEGARRTRLANMGIAPEGGSEAWNRAQMSMDANRNKAYSDAALSSIAGGGAEAQRELGLATGAMGAENQARQQAIAEMAQQRGMSLNELNALLTGQQVSMPQMPSFNQAQRAEPLQALAAAQARGSFDQSNQGGSGIGTLIGTGVGAYFGMPGVGAAAGSAVSDRRLKKNIVPLGGGWYAFSYLWDSVLRFGVMAQELLLTKPEAVIVMPNGYYAVDYSKI